MTPSATQPPPKAMSPLLSLACEAASRFAAKAVLVLPEAPLDWKALVELQRGGTRVMIAPQSIRHAEAAKDAGLIVITIDAAEAAITERISLALIQAVADDRLQAGDRVVVVYSGFEAEALDSITVVSLGEHLERLTSRDLRELQTSVPFETLRAVVDLAVEIGREGREGKPVGTLIVVGDAREVLSRSRTLGFDPFKGYRRKDRNLRDSKVREAIKEIAQLDGAFVVSRDGTVEGACRIIDAPTTGLALPKGLGTRHWAAAAITKATEALAVVVSQSTGSVRLFQDGEIVLRIAPTRHARALKWKEDESEPTPAKA